MAIKKKTVVPEPRPMRWILRQTTNGYTATLEVEKEQDYKLMNFVFKSVAEAKSALKGELVILERTITKTTRNEVSA